MDEGTFESIRDVIGSFFQQQDHLSSLNSEQTDNESHDKVTVSNTNQDELEGSPTQGETSKCSSFHDSKEEQVVEPEFEHESKESSHPLKRPTLNKNAHEWMQESARKALNAIRHSSSLIIYHTQESRIVPFKPKTAESLVSDHSLQALNIHPNGSSKQSFIEQDVLKSKALQELDMVYDDIAFVDHQLIRDIDELSSKEFDELLGDLPDILPALDGFANLGIDEKCSNYEKSSSTNKKLASLHDSESFSNSATNNSSHNLFLPHLSDSPTKSMFLASFEAMFKPIEELPLPYSF